MRGKIKTMTPRERNAVSQLADALTLFDDPHAARAGIAEAVCLLAGAEGGVLLIGRKFSAPAPGDRPDADYGPIRPKAEKVLELLPVFGHTNPVVPLLPRVDQSVFSVPEVASRSAWDKSPFYREFLGPVMDTHGVLGVKFGPIGGMWLGHPDRRRFSRAVLRTVAALTSGIKRGLANLERFSVATARVQTTGGIDPDAARAAGLTSRELDVLIRLAELGVSYHTVTTHSRSLFAKLGVNNRVDAISAVRRCTAVGR
jgi:DNA-binding CsgD family transcriptional regulator